MPAAFYSPMQDPTLGTYDTLIATSNITVSPPTTACAQDRELPRDTSQCMHFAFA